MTLPKGLIVSCQALSDEPLHSSYIMGRMAVAAMEGGAVGIRANSVEDIAQIKKEVDLPILGIIKRDYDDSDVFITATRKEVDELVSVGCDVIAVDATHRMRPHGINLDTFYQEIRQAYPHQELMADCATLEEMIHASKLGFDYIGTTLVGYTKESEHLKIETDDFILIQEALKHITQPLVAEGNIDTPEKARRVLELGAHSVVVGSAITRPQLITKKFYDEIIKEKK